MQLSVQNSGRRLVSNLPIFVAPDSDIDGDGIYQPWEDAALERVKPMIELDEDEEWLDEQNEEHMVFFGRVAPYPYSSIATLPSQLPRYVLFYYAFGWSMDYGGDIAGLSPSWTDLLKAHRGDTERSIQAWKVVDAYTLELEWVTTSAHSDVNRHHGVWHAWDRTCNLGYIEDYVPLAYDNLTEVMCGNLEFDAAGHVVLYASEGKHALYPSHAICEAVTVVVLPVGCPPCLWYGEDCSGGGRWSFPVYNAGEPDPGRRYQLIDNLDEPSTWRGLTAAQINALTGLYPGEAVWSGHITDRARWSPSGQLLYDGGKFCGGHPADTLDMPEPCSGKLGGKLGMSEQWTDAGPPSELKERLDATYYIAFQTGNVDYAGTDARISLDVYGTLGSISQYIYSNPDPPRSAQYVGGFERGDLDHISVLSADLGELSSIRVSIDNSGSNPRWYLDRVEITRRSDGRRWVFYARSWVEPGGSPVTLLACPNGQFTDYTVQITTGDVDRAGTDADVYINLYGADGSQTGDKYLDNPNVDDFERNTTGTFQFSACDVGTVTRIRLSHDNSGANAEWYVSNVVVRKTGGGPWNFPVNAWIPTRPDGQLYLYRP